MSGEEAKALLQEKCSGKIEEKESNGVTKLSCSLKDKGDYFYKNITLRQKDKVGKIKLSLAMNYKSDASDEDIEKLRKSEAEKLVQAYGKPTATLEGREILDLPRIIEIDSLKTDDPAEIVMCWGDCSEMKTEDETGLIPNPDAKHYAMAGILQSGMGVDIALTVIDAQLSKEMTEAK